MYMAEDGLSNTAVGWLPKYENIKAKTKNCYVPVSSTEKKKVGL